MRLTVLLLFIFGLLIGSQHTLAQVYDTLQAAQKDPDFALQGEYVDSKRGLQVIALGDGEFEVVTYTDGLPGAGWDGKGKQSIKVDTDQLEAMLDNFDRVDRKSPTLGAKPPANAVVLFDGSQESLEKHWQKGAKITEGGLLMQGCTSIDTFGDYILHLEFRTPFMPKARGQGRGNSGLYHQGRYETQMLDSFGLEGKNNEAGGLYSIRAPDVNMCLPPMAWQTYDVEFTAARFEGDKKTANARITVKLNGVVVHRDVNLPKSTTAAPVKESPEDGPIYLQNHGNPVRYRNIWVVPRDVEAEARRPIIPGFERFHATTADAVGGQILMAELNCVACHGGDSQLVASHWAKQGPVLDEVGKRLKPEWILKFLTTPHEMKPGTTMPDLMAGMAVEDRKSAALALTNFLVGTDALNGGGKSGNTNEGQKLFHESGCVACHMPQDGRKASTATSVPLVGLGEKYSRASLEQFLKDPLKVRPSGRMPKLNLNGDAHRHIAQYLTGDASVTFGDMRDKPKEPNMKFAAYYGGYDKLPDLSKLEPDLTGVSRGLDIGAGKRNENVVLSFTGFLPIEKQGRYSFRIGSDDGSKLYIDGKLILDNDGIHPTTFKEDTILLGPGKHAIRVDWFEAGGGEQLSLDWAGPGVKSGRIDKAIVMTRDGNELPVAPTAEPNNPDLFVFDSSLVATGRQLFQSLGCANCHQRSEEGKRLLSSVRAPSLADCAPGKGCLSDKVAAPLPNYDLITSQKIAISEALGGVSGSPNRNSALVHTMTSLNCYACHERGSMGGAESDRNALFTSSIPEMGDEGRLAPTLDGVGDKLQKNWIQSVVTGGNKNRPYMRVHMPGFGKAGEQLASMFEELDAQAAIDLPDIDEPEHRLVATGRKLVGAKGLACVACHTYGKFRATGIQAIALDTMTKRIREDWFHRYLPDPQVYRPGTRMPTGFPEGKSTVQEVYGGDKSKQIAALWAYLEKGDKGGVPEGIVSGMVELKPTDKPVLYRNFIEGVSPRGIAVGYPEKANLCWDANELSLTLIWQDRFIDAAKHWVGRGPGNQTPLGGSTMTLEKSSPVAVLKSPEADWPAESPRERGYKFLGYRLNDKGQPTFRYRTPWASVEDQPVPVVRDDIGMFRREIVITPLVGVKLAGKIYFRAAVGKVEKTGKGYVMNDSITVAVAGGGEPILRESGGKTELLVPIDGPTTILQDLNW